MEAPKFRRGHPTLRPVGSHCKKTAVLPLQVNLDTLAKPDRKLNFLKATPPRHGHTELAMPGLQRQYFYTNRHETRFSNSHPRTHQLNTCQLLKKNQRWNAALGADDEETLRQKSHLELFKQQQDTIEAVHPSDLYAAVRENGFGSP